MSLLSLAEIALYEVVDIVTFAVLAVLPFRPQLRSRRAFFAVVSALYVLGIGRRAAALLYPPASAALSVLWIAMYLAAYRYLIRAAVPKLLFVLISMVNYASVTAILYSALGELLFADAVVRNPYGIEACISAGLVQLVTIPVLYAALTSRVAPLIQAPENDAVWRSLWLVPATFCVFFYYNLYNNEGVLQYASDARSLIFALVISAGSFFVTYLLLKLVETSSLTLRLRAENHQLALQTLQYQNLVDRMEETRRARHDLRQCMAVLETYLQEGDIDRLDGFVHQMCAALPENPQLFYCRRPALNALLGYYAGQAAQMHIGFDVQVEFPETDAVPDNDLVVLFGNLLENAVEACARQTRGARFLRLRVRTQGQAVTVVLDNSCDPDSVHKKVGFLSSKRDGPGFGMSSVRKIAERYGGTAEFRQNGGVFEASVLFMARGPEPAKS